MPSCKTFMVAYFCRLAWAVPLFICHTIWHWTKRHLFPFKYVHVMGSLFLETCQEFNLLKFQNKSMPPIPDFSHLMPSRRVRNEAFKIHNQVMDVNEAPGRWNGNIAGRCQIGGKLSCTRAWSLLWICFQFFKKFWCSILWPTHLETYCTGKHNYKYKFEYTFLGDILKIRLMPSSCKRLIVPCN